MVGTPRFHMGVPGKRRTMKKGPKFVRPAPVPMMVNEPRVILVRSPIGMMVNRAPSNHRMSVESPVNALANMMRGLQIRAPSPAVTRRAAKRRRVSRGSRSRSRGSRGSRRS